MNIKVLVAVLALALSACENTGPKQQVGGLLGAAAGGLIGSQIGSGTGQAAAVGLGVLLGALAGSDIGRDLDAADRAYIEQTNYSALETAPIGSTQNWHNPDSGNSGTMTPLKTYQQADGRYCREFTQTIYVGGEPHEGYGTACRQPDGSWKITG